MKSLRHCLVIALLGVALPVAASASLTQPAECNVTFAASGPGGMKIVGSTPELVLAEDPASLSVTVPLARLTTGIGLRDAHMRDKYLQISAYPTASLRVARAELKLPASGSQLEGDANGTMTLHGKSHPVVFHYSAKRDGATYAVSGTVRINMKDHGIEVPSYLGVGIRPDVDVSVHFVAADAS